MGELKRGIERAELAEKNLKGVEDELDSVGENMKILENSAAKALEREEKLVEKILQLQHKYKAAEARFEYGEMNITKLNQRIDNIEDEIYREKLKIKNIVVSFIKTKTGVILIITIYYYHLIDQVGTKTKTIQIVYLSETTYN